MGDDTPEYDPDKLRPREEMMENVEGLVAIMREEVAFLEDVHTRLDEGEPMEDIFEDFMAKSQLDDIDSYLASL